MLHSILLLLASALIGYLFGSIPNAVLIGKVFYHKDVREYGSKNAGGTNAGRVLGKKVGFIVIVLDLIKTIVPIYLCYCLLEYTPLSEYGLSEYGYIVAAFFALIGHCFPVFAGFKGGKAVSSFAADLPGHQLAHLPDRFSLLHGRAEMEKIRFARFDFGFSPRYPSRPDQHLRSGKSGNVPLPEFAGLFPADSGFQRDPDRPASVEYRSSDASRGKKDHVDEITKKQLIFYY